MNSKKDKYPKGFDVDFSPLHNMFDRMDAFFNESFKHFDSFFNIQPMRVHVEETDANVLVTADLPGFNRDQITLEIMSNQLRIIGKNHMIQEEENDQTNHYNKTQSQQTIERTITLPFIIPEKETNATLRNGRLKITIPKKAVNKTFLDINDEFSS